MTDRYTYLPTIGIFLMLGIDMTALADRTFGSYRLRFSFAAPFVIVILLLSVMTSRQLGIWKNGEVLWKNVIRVEPGASMAYNNLGLLLLARHKEDDAIPLFETAIKLEPSNADALSNLAICRFDEQRYDEAYLLATRALAIRPRHAGAHSILGEIWFTRRKYQQSLDSFEMALQVDADLPIRYYNVALVLEKLARVKEACGYWEMYLRTGLAPPEQKEVYDHMNDIHCF